MNVFVTGATGVLGRSVSRMLADTGHHVRALARSSANELRLRAMGAEPVRGDLFNVPSLRNAVGDSDAILHLATHIPGANQARRRESWRENDRIRIEGTRNLVDVALESGISTFIYPGVVFVYPDGGEQWVDAMTPPVRSPLLDSSLRAEAEVERFTQAGKRGIVLRMGAFYGPTAASTRDLLKAARYGVAMVFGRASSYQSLIWIDDAAVAVVDALSKAPPGTYDIVDDEPLRRRELASALAHAVGRRWLLRPPAFLLRVFAGKNAMFLTRSQRVSNRKFKEATGWSPTVASCRLGLKLTAIEP
jgi:nucleoside-diphosphate-sugar epimerase